MSFSILVAALLFSGAILHAIHTPLMNATVLARGRRRRLKRRARQWYTD